MGTNWQQIGKHGNTFRQNQNVAKSFCEGYIVASHGKFAV